MKAILLSIAVVMAATGCETTQQKAARMEAKGYVRTPAGDWVPEGTPFFGDGKPWAPRGTPIAFDPTVFNQAMAPQAPPPIIVAPPSQGSGVTMASQVGNTTVVTSFGGRRITRPYNPPIDTSGTPIYYTAPIQQP